MEKKNKKNWYVRRDVASWLEVYTQIDEDYQTQGHWPFFKRKIVF